MRINVQGVAFDNVTLKQAVDTAVGFIRSGGFHYAVTPNPEIVMLAEKNPAYRQVINGADLVVPDGIGVIKAAKILGRPLQERVPGIELASGIMAELAPTGGRVYLLGAKPGVAECAGKVLAQRYPGLVICGAHDGYFSEEDTPALVSEIAAAAPDLLFVCLGFPKQEFWITTYGKDTGAKLAIGLGGSLDVFAGTVERAPESWQKLGLEWAYRLKKEPWRIKRMAKLPLFLVKAAGSRITGK